MKILHTESSRGWGGQEIRILREAEGMRGRGHEVILAVARGGGLVAKAQQAGFLVYELTYSKSSALITVWQLVRICLRHDIDLLNTHSSMDAWLGGIAARFARLPIIRTRHLSTAIRKGLNSRLLYGKLSDFVVTTSSAILPMIAQQAALANDRLRCVPTGVDPVRLQVDPKRIDAFRKALGVTAQDCLIGTVCFVRSWKGIPDFLRAAEVLREEKNLKWVVVGGGYVEDYKAIAEKMQLGKSVIFTGHLESPYSAIAALDIFALLSTANEGISQATLQAAYLERPLLTTDVGGLPEVCLHGETGLCVPPRSPEQVAAAVLQLSRSPRLRKNMGRQGRLLVEEKFTLQHTLDQMERVYELCLSDASRGAAR